MFSAACALLEAGLRTARDEAIEESQEVMDVIGLCEAWLREAQRGENRTNEEVGNDVDATSTSGTRRIDSGVPAAVAKEEDVYAREVIRETQSREVGGDAGVPPNQGAMFSPHQETNTNPEILGDAGRSKSEASLDASKLLVVSMHGILTHQNRVGSKPHRDVKRRAI